MVLSENARLVLQIKFSKENTGLLLQAHNKGLPIFDTLVNSALTELERKG